MNITRLSMPANARSSGEMRSRPAPSSAISSAKPTSRRFQGLKAAIEAREGHHLRPHRLPGGSGVEQQALVRVRREHHRHRAALRQGIAHARRHRQAALRVEVDLRCSLKHRAPPCRETPGHPDSPES